MRISVSSPVLLSSPVSFLSQSHFCFLISFPVSFSFQPPVPLSYIVQFQVQDFPAVSLPCCFDMVSLLTHQPSSLSQASQPVLSSTFSTLPYSSHSTWNCVFCLFLSPLLQSLDMALCLQSFPLSLTPVTRYGTVSSVFSSLPYSSHSTWHCVFSLFLSPLLQSLDMELCLQSFPLSLTPVTRHETAVVQLENDDSRKW